MLCALQLAKLCLPVLANKALFWFYISLQSPAFQSNPASHDRASCDYIKVQNRTFKKSISLVTHFIWFHLILCFYFQLSLVSQKNTQKNVKSFFIVAWFHHESFLSIKLVTGMRLTVTAGCLQSASPSSYHTWLTWQVDEAIQPGLTSLNWTSLNIDKYLDRIDKALGKQKM